MSSRRCKSCRWWDTGDTSQKMGLCRVDSPTVVAGGDSEWPAMFGWPITGDEDWCGRYGISAAALEALAGGD